MNDMDYKPNSHRSKEDQQLAQSNEKRVEKVVNSKVKTKKNEMRKFADVFIAEDLRNVKDYIIMDVIIPAIKKAIVDTITDSVTMIFGTGPRSRSDSPKVSYQKCFTSSRDDRYASNSNSVSTRSRFEYDDLVFETKYEAESVLEEMGNVIDRYGFVTVMDMYDIVQLSPPYTSNKYGWTNLSTVDIVRGGGGWVIKLPKALPIN